MLEIVDEKEEEQQKPIGSKQLPVEPGVEDTKQFNSAADDELNKVIPKVESDDPDADTAKRPLYKRPAVLAVAGVILVVSAILGLRYLLYARSHESTDDAFIDGHIIQISPKVSAYVAKIYITDNQHVKAGDLLVELDPRDYEIKLQQAKAALDAGRARHTEAQTTVSLTRATGAANIQQAAATVRQARSAVESSRAAAASDQSRASQASSAIATAQANLQQSRAQVLAAEAEATRAAADVVRYQALYSKDEISKQQVDQAVASERTANAQLDAARQKVVAMNAQVNEARSAEAAAVSQARRSETQITGSQAGVGEATGRLEQANTSSQQVAVAEAQAKTAGANIEELEAQVAQAEVQLSYTKIYATEDGRVTRKSVEEGALVQVGQPLLAIVPGEVWVTANFKENQIGRMVPGQLVEITVDAYPDRTFKGHVDSIQAGTGARFSLIPPENATGNYVKVVQRVPVKIMFDEPPDPKHMLSPGMSVIPEVAVR
jgi:membrane fusion protein, multidrug efflux system